MYRNTICQDTYFLELYFDFQYKYSFLVIATKLFIFQRNNKIVNKIPIKRRNKESGKYSCKSGDGNYKNEMAIDS